MSLGTSSSKKMIIHVDNAKRFIHEQEYKTASHPPFSESRTGRLFHIQLPERELQWSMFEDPERLSEVMMIILNGIIQEILLSTFQELVEKLHLCIANNGEYVEQHFF
jgi:hypothetical protein